ncbi:MAG: hypothetical protein ACTS4V_01585 [Candidatus Hodgkinia cicadicola]
MDRNTTETFQIAEALDVSSARGVKRRTETGFRVGGCASADMINKIGIIDDIVDFSKSAEGDCSNWANVHTFVI